MKDEENKRKKTGEGEGREGKEGRKGSGKKREGRERGEGRESGTALLISHTVNFSAETQPRIIP